MATEKFTAAGAFSANLAGAELNTGATGLANGSAVLLSGVIDNTVNLDMFFDISVSLATGPTWASPFRIDLYVFPLNSDGTTYGPNNYAAAAPVSNPLPANYFAGSIGLDATSTTGARTGTLTGIFLGPRKYKVLLVNNGGGTLANAGNTVEWCSYNRSVA